jgi:trehalose 2-sulfotransferase
MIQIANRFDFEYDVAVEPTVSYMICSLPRSGSSLLCEALANTLHAGMPAEYFNPGMVAVMKRRWKVESFDDYLRELLARKTSPNGVFGLKVHWGQYTQVVEDRDPESIFPNIRFIRIRREDRVRQAVSWVRARQTGDWSVSWKDPRGGHAQFDPDEIGKSLGRLEREDAAWEAFFRLHSISPHRLSYEELVEAREPTLRGIFAFLGVDLPEDLRFDPPALERQADRVSDEWVARYLAESRTGRT